MSRSLKRASSKLVTLEKKELFFVTLAHDLKNPLQALRSSLKLLIDGSFGEFNPKQKEVLNIVHETLNYMNDMLQSILLSFKLENGDVVLDKLEFSAIDLLESCINEVKALAKSKNIEILLKIETAELKLFADEIQLRRVISNLLNNALNYSFKDSKLIVTVGSNGENLIFSFENSSPEIPSDIKAHIFEKYVSNAHTGTGLGLYFSRQIVEAHGGRIYVDGSGTRNRFTFEIPQNNPTKSSILL